MDVGNGNHRATIYSKLPRDAERGHLESLYRALPHEKTIWRQFMLVPTGEALAAQDEQA